MTDLTHFFCESWVPEYFTGPLERVGTSNGMVSELLDDFYGILWLYNVIIVI